MTTTSLVPKRTASLVPSTEATPTALATGSRCTPAESGEYPLKNWKYCVIRKMKPNSVKNATVTAPLAAAKRGLRNRATSSIGARARRSQATNTPSSAAAAAKPASVRAPLQP